MTCAPPSIRVVAEAGPRPWVPHGWGEGHLDDTLGGRAAATRSASVFQSPQGRVLWRYLRLADVWAHQGVGFVGRAQRWCRFVSLRVLASGEGWGLDRVEKVDCDGYVFDYALFDVDSQTELLEEVTKLISSDQVNGWGTITGGFSLGCWGESAGGDDQALFSSAGHCSAEVAYHACRDTPRVTLRLEISRKAHKRKLVDANTINTAISRLAEDFDVSETGFTEQSHREALKRSRIHHFQRAEESLLPVVLFTADLEVNVGVLLRLRFGLGATHLGSRVGVGLFERRVGRRSVHGQVVLTFWCE